MSAACGRAVCQSHGMDFKPGRRAGRGEGEDGRKECGSGVINAHCDEVKWCCNA